MIKTIAESSQGQFEKMINDYLSDGWILLSSNCGFINSEQYDFQHLWQAILFKNIN